MSERATLRVILEVGCEDPGDATEYLQSRMSVSVTGVLRQRASDERVNAIAGEMTRKARWGVVAGDPIIVISDEVALAAAGSAIVGWSGLKYNENGALGGLTRVVIDDDTDNEEEGVYDEAFASLPAFGAPEGVWDSTNSYGFIGAGVFSAPFAARDASLWLGIGPWRLLMMEFEEGTVEVDVERS